MRQFLFLLLLLGTASALGNYNTSATVVYYLYANNSDNFDHYNSIVDYNLTPIAGLFSATCDNYQVTLYEGEEEIPALSNLSLLPYKQLTSWAACDNTSSVNLRIAINSSQLTDNQIVGVLYITPASVINAPLTVTYDNIENNNTGYIFDDTEGGPPEIPRLNLTLTAIQMHSTSNRGVSFNLTGAINGTWAITQFSALASGGTIGFHSRSSNYTMHSIYSDFGSNPQRTSAGQVAEFRLNSTLVNSSSWGSGEVNTTWRLREIGCLHEIYHDLNASPNLTYSFCNDDNPLNTRFGWFIADSYDGLFYIDAWAFTYAASDTNYWVRAYNNTDAVWISNQSPTMTTIISPINTTYNSTAIPFNITANVSANSYSCNWTRSDYGTNATNFTVVNNTYYSTNWELPHGGYSVSATCSNGTDTSTSSLVFSSRQLLGWVNTSAGTSFYNSSLNTSYCEAMISGVPAWVNFTVIYPNGTAVHNLNATNGTNLTATGNWISANFTANVTGIWNCTASAYDGTSIITNTTQFDIIGANAPVVYNFTTSRGLSFDFVATNDTNCTATVDDPDGTATLEWYNFTVTNPVGTKIIDNVNGTSDGLLRTSPFFVAGTVGVWTCSVTAYDGLSTQTNSSIFSVNTPAPPSGGGGGGSTIIINQTTPEQEFILPEATGQEAFVQIVLLSAALFIGYEMFKGR